MLIMGDQTAPQDVDETFKALQAHRGVKGVIVLNYDGIPIRSTFTVRRSCSLLVMARSYLFVGCKDFCSLFSSGYFLDFEITKLFETNRRSASFLFDGVFRPVADAVAESARIHPLTLSQERNSCSTWYGRSG